MTSDQTKNSKYIYLEFNSNTAEFANAVLKTLRTAIKEKEAVHDVVLDWNNCRQGVPIIRESVMLSSWRDTILDIFFLLGQLPKLRDFLLTSTESMHFPVAAMTELLKASSSDSEYLNYLRLQGIHVVGTIEELNSFALALRNQTHLKEVTFDNVTAPLEMLLEEMELEAVAVPDESLLDPIVQTLSSMPSMKSLKLTATPISAVAVQAIFQSRSIEEVSFLRCNSTFENNNALTIMTRLLETNVTLKHLSLRYCGLDQPACSQLMQMLLRNNCLAEITLEALWDEFGADLANVLSMNSSLIKLHLTIYVSKDTQEKITLFPNVAEVASALATNSTLKGFTFHLRNWNKIGQSVLEDYFVEALNRNFVLEEMHLFDSPRLCCKIQLLLKLNRLGRKRLYSNRNDKELWMDALVSNAHDLDVLFSLLVDNPSLCCGTYD